MTEKQYEDKVKEIFSHTSNEMFMGGELRQIKLITDNIVFIESEHRMDANMMATLRKHLKGHIICGNWDGNVLIIECDSDKWVRE